MKPVLDLKYTILLTAGLWSTLMLTGCSLTDRIPGSKQLKELIPGGEEETPTLTVGDLTVPNGMNYLKVESVGPVTGSRIPAAHRLPACIAKCSSTKCKHTT